MTIKFHDQFKQFYVLLLLKHLPLNFLKHTKLYKQLQLVLRYFYMGRHLTRIM